MGVPRIYKSSAFFRPVEGEPVRSVVTESPDAIVVAWHVKRGQRISPHIHPNGQDTWIILSGGGEYTLDETGSTKSVAAGDVVVAHPGEVHGVLNTGDEPLIFISIVSPAAAGFRPV